LKRFINKIYFSIVKIIFDLIYQNLKISDVKFFEKNVKITKIKLNSDSNKNYKIYELNKGRIYSDLSQHVAVIKDKYIMKYLSTQITDNYLVDIAYNKILKTGTRKLIQQKISGNVLSLVQGTSAINNYGHWMLDIIPKMILTEEHKDLKSFDAIYLPNIKKQFQIDSLKYFDIDFNKVIDGSVIRHIYANQITIPEHPYWRLNEFQIDTVGNIDSDIVNKIRLKFLNKPNTNKKKRKLFIDRSDSNFLHSQIENYSEISSLLKKYNFDKIKLSNLTFEEQITYFSEAEIIVGAHGAGFCNLIFCPPKTKVIELTSHDYKCDVFRNISKINNLNYFNLISSKNISANGLSPDIYITEKDLTKVII